MAPGGEKLRAWGRSCAGGNRRGLGCMSPPRKETIADGVEIWLGDCRDVLPLIGRVDAVVTDPVWPNCPAGAISGADDPWGLWATAWGVMPECDRAVTVMRCDSDPRFLFSIPK